MKRRSMVLHCRTTIMREREREREREVSLLRAMWNWAEREDRVGERELGLEGSITLLIGQVEKKRMNVFQDLGFCSNGKG